MKGSLKIKISAMLTLLLTLALCLVSCKEAVSVVSAVINENGELILTMSDNTTQNLGKVKGEDGNDGKDGKDAILPEIVDENPQGLAFYLLSNDTYAVSIGDAYYLKEIVIPATYKEKPVTCIGSPWDLNWENEANPCCAGFGGAPYLTKITIPDSVKTIGAQAFLECSRLTTVVFSAESELSEIGEEAFYGCTALWDVSLPNKLTHIYRSAFQNCTNLWNLDIPDSVKTIEENAFLNCSRLVKSENKLNYVDTWLISADLDIVTATLRSDTTAIADEAFARCSELTSLYIPAKVINIGRAVFNDTRKIQTIVVETGNPIYYVNDNKLYGRGIGIIAPLPDGVAQDPF